MNQRLFKNIILMITMGASAYFSMALRPIYKTADSRPVVHVEELIPMQFEDWAIDKKRVYQQVNPVVSSTIQKIYTSVLERTYINGNGYSIMISIPYGTNQSDELSAHDPEGCYPSQGFQIISKFKQILSTDSGNVPVRRMETINGPRHEVVTYWFTVGNSAVNNDLDRKLVQLRYSFKREIPDGMLVRVSSVDQDAANAYKMQDRFLQGLLKNLTPDARERIIGARS